MLGMPLFVTAALLGQDSPRPPTDSAALVMIGRSPAIHALVNGRDALLEIDTGSFELRLTPAYAAKWGITDGRVTLKLGESPGLTLKPLVEDISAPEPLPISTGWMRQSDGIIGLDVLRMFAIGIDTNQGRVSLWYGGKLTTTQADLWAHADGAKVPPITELPLHSHGMEDWFHIDAKVNGKPLDLLLDTGTAYSTVNPSLARPLGLKVIGETPVMEIGHTERLQVATADSITFGPFEAEFPVVNIESSDDDQVQGILGTEALGTGKFLIDMPASELYVWHMPADWSNPLERRLHQAGIDMFPSKDGKLVMIVKPGSDVASYGVESGDQLISIGDVSVREMVEGLQGPMDKQRMSKMLKVGLDAYNGDLVIKIQTKLNNIISYPLPK